MFKFIIYDKEGNVLGYTNNVSGDRISAQLHDKKVIINKSDIHKIEPLDFYALNKIMRDRGVIK